MDRVERQTGRLILRQWKDSDLEPFYRMSSDPQVMEYFPSLLSKAETVAFVTKASRLIEQRGWGFWALEEKATSEFIGFAGLHVPMAELPCSPCVEIGWRLRRSSWGQGFATEAAGKILDFAFQDLGLAEVVSFTAIGNRRSRKVMERLGMRPDGEFDHPALPPASPLRWHVLFRMTEADWRNGTRSVHGRRPKGR